MLNQEFDFFFFFQVADVVDLIQGLSYIPYRKAIFKEGDDPFQEVSNSFDEFVSQSSLIRLPEHSDSISSTPITLPSWDEETATSTCPAASPKGCSTANGVSVCFVAFLLCNLSMNLD